MIDAPFDSIDDDDLTDIFRPPSPQPTQTDSNNSVNYDNFVAQNINLSQPDLDLNFENNPAQMPLSKYVTEIQFKDSVNSFSKETFSLFNLNVRSINKHFEELQLLLDNKQSFSVIGLTETWLSSDSNQPFALNGYDFIVNNRQNKVGGGVALYVSKSYEYNIIKNINIMNNNVESLFIEIVIHGNKNIIIGIIYRPPNSSSIDFLKYLDDLVKNPVFTNKRSFIMGDFNLDLLKHENNNKSQEFLEILMSGSFLPLISKPTRIVDNSATLIDNIFCNTLPLPESSIILSDISDHFPIMTHFTINQIITKPYPIPLRRRATQESLNSLAASLDNVDWSRVKDCKNIHSSFDNFLNVFNN